MRSFYLYKRTGLDYYYVQFINPLTKKPMATRSTGMKNREEAERKALEWLYSGNLRKPKVTPAIHFENLITQTKLTEEDVFSLQNAIDKYYGNVVSATRKNHSSVPDLTAKVHKPTRQFKKHILIDYLVSFWDFDKSEYVHDKLIHGKRIGYGKGTSFTIIKGHTLHFQAERTL